MNERKKTKTSLEQDNAPSRAARRKKEKKLRKSRFTVLDFFILIVLVLCVVGIGFRSTIAELLTEAEPGQEVSIAVQIDNLTAEQVNGMRGNDTFYLDGEEFGRLAQFTHEAQKKVDVGIDEDGKAVFVEVTDPLLYTVKATITVMGHYSEEGLTLGGNISLLVGKTFKIDTSSYSVTVTITEIPRK